MERFEFEGVWWLPEHDGHRVHGTLVVGGNEEVTLHVYGALSPSDVDWATVLSFDAPITVVDLIYGETEKGQPVTLRACREADGFTNLTTGYRREDYRCRVAFVGKHFSSVDSICSTNATFGFSHIKWFAQLNGLEQTIFPEGKTKRVTYQFALPDAVTGNAGKFGDVAIECTINTNPAAYAGLVVKQQEFIHVNGAPESTTFEQWYTDYLEPFQHLMTLATETPNNVTAMYFDFLSKNAIAVYFWVPSLDQLPPEQHIGNPLLSLEDIHDDFGGAVKRWLQAYQDLDGVFDFYFGQMYLREHNRQSRVREFAQALEVFHERHIDGSRMDFKIRVEKYLEWLGDLTKPLLTDPAKFAADVSETRNYLVHYNLRRKANAVNGFDLQILSRFLGVFIRAGLLRVLGLSEEDVHKKLVENSRYQQLARHPW